ncbi:hypothetical protein [Nostoc sp.]|uniref:hypothetical protein n=1 Tax=Nostoc sp. TaxID=1180 RepID=UPI002FF96706
MNYVSTIQDRNLKSNIVSVYTLLRDVRIATGNVPLESKRSLIHPSAAGDLFLVTVDARHAKLHHRRVLDLNLHL